MRRNTIELNWNKNHTWGMCPKGKAWIKDRGFIETKRITGCGYDKASTATAQLLNQDVNLIKLLTRVKPEHLYGWSIYDNEARFESGVGISCHVNILKELGLNPFYYNGETFDLLVYDNVELEDEY